ncbi:MAG: sugar phosphate isomerase/epimerase [Gemmataceae bacterium]|nr:sugar phosphate isomerase/epimerase [Gemmataceae bacterium]
MKYAICNETFEGWEFARICAFIKGAGYQGVEIAPFTLAKLITDVTPEQRKKLRAEAQKEGIAIVGLHWLLAKTEGLSLTSPELEVRKATANYLVELAKACADLGGELMVLGSPAQRRIPQGYTSAQARSFAIDTLKQTVPGFEKANVKLCLEPLSPPEADFINTAAEGCSILDEINHPLYVLHLDVKAMATESSPVPEIIRQYIKRTGHFHANDANRRGPGFGAVDFVPIFQALLKSAYKQWVSVEVFDYSPDPETIATQSIHHMKSCMEKALQLTSS